MVDKLLQTPSCLKKIIFRLRKSRPKDALSFVINNVWFYSVFRWKIETNTTFLTFLIDFSSLIWSVMISMYGCRELLIHLNMMQDRIEPKMRETIPTESVIHNVLNASFSMSMAPMDSSKIQCLWVTVKARTRKIASSTRVGNSKQ